MSKLLIKNVAKKFEPIDVLYDINLRVEDKDFLVLVGPSGCGKSTLLNIIAGLLDLSDGEILIDGERIEHLEPKDRNIAMVFQSYALYPSMTVEKNIAFPLRMAGVSKRERMFKVNQVAKMLQIESLLKRKPGVLSGGQRQRVAMGRALVRNPKLFLFDEPLSNLDAKLRVDMRTEIKRLHQHLGATMIYVTHDQVEAMTMATKIAVMNNGVVQQFGSPDEIYSFPANAFVATFMGSPAMNLFDGQIDDSSNQILLKDGLKLPIPANAAELSKGRKVQLGLRPEWFGIGKITKSSVNISAKVEVIEPTGPDIFVTLNSGSVEFMARLPAGVDLKLGEKACFTVQYDNAVLFDKATGTCLYKS